MINIKKQKKKSKKKLYIVLICITLVCMIVGGFIYKNKNTTRNILIQEIFDENNKFGTYDSEMLKSYNAENIEKIENGQDLCAEDYFLIAYEYCAVKKDREEGMKYAIPAKNKVNIFTNRIANLYNNLLIDYYNTYEKNDEVVLKNIDNMINEATAEDWNKYSGLLNSHLTLSINFEDKVDFLKSRAEKILEEEDNLNSTAKITLIDDLAVMNFSKGYYAKSLENCMQNTTILKLDDNTIDPQTKSYYEARTYCLMGNIYTTLGELNTARELYEQALEVEIDNEKMNNSMKIPVYYNLINLYANEKDVDKIGEIVDKYEKFFKDNNDAKDEITYYIMSVNYWIKNYELYGLEEDLNKAKDFMKLIDEHYDGSKTTFFNFEAIYNQYSNYLKYLDGNIDEALEGFKEILENSTENITKRDVLEKMIKIYKQEGMYEEACKYSDELSSMRESESVLINKDYTAYSVEKYENELELKRLNEEKLHNYIKAFILILVTSISIIYMIMKNRNLRVENITDGLTRVYNRTYFNEIFEKKIVNDKDFYLLIFDIDNFKKVNDTYGHLVGDEVLKKIAKTTKEVAGSRGDVFRYGGEEFIVLTNTKDEIAAINLAEKIRKGIEELVWDNGMNITISMGIADSKIEKENVLEVADKRLYTSKTTGKNKVTWHDESFMKIG